MKKRKVMIAALALTMSLMLSTVIVFGVATANVEEIKDGSAGEEAYRNNADLQGDYAKWNDATNAIEADEGFIYRLYETGKSESTVTATAGLQSTSDVTFTNVDGTNVLDVSASHVFDVTSFNGTKEDSIVIKYTNYKIADPMHGSADGKGEVAVDIVATVKDWGIKASGKYTTSESAFALSKTLTGGYPRIQICNIDELQVNYQYFLAGTDTPYELKTNATYRDIDAGQGIAFKGSTIQRTAVTPDTNIMYGKSGDWHVFTTSSTDAEDTDEPKNALGIMFSTKNETLTYISNQVPLGTPSGEYALFVPSTYSFFAPPEIPPAKKMTDEDETEVAKNTIGYDEELTWTYSIIQHIPAGINTAFYYEEFIMSDKIDTCLTVVDVKITKRDGKDVTENFNITIGDDNKVTASAKSSYLKDAAFYGGTTGNRFTMEIKVRLNAEKVKENHDAHGHGDATNWSVSNQADTRFGDDPFESDRVPTYIIREYPEFNAPNKTVSDANETAVTANTLAAPDETFTYDINHTLESGYDALTYLNSYGFTDTLEAVLKPTSAAVYNGTTDVSAMFDISINGQTVTANMKEANLIQSSTYGKTYTLRIGAAIRTDEYDTPAELSPWLSADGLTLTIPNKGKVTATDYSPNSPYDLDTNVVTTKVGLPSTPPPDNPQGEPQPGLRVTKEAEPYEYQACEEIPYTITLSQTNANAAAYQAVMRDESLPEGIEVKEDSITVSGINRSYTAAKIKGGLEFKTDYLKYGETVTIKFIAIADKTANGTVAKNTAIASAWGVPDKEDSTTVYINSPKIDVEKSISREGHANINDTINYEIQIKQINPGCFMRDIVLSDEIITKGVTLDKGSFSVTDAEGNMLALNTDYKVNVQGNAYTMTFTKGNMGYYRDPAIPAANDARGKGTGDYENLDLQKEYIVTYTATIDDPGLAGLTAENTAKVPATENTNGDPIKDNPDIPSGGDEDSVVLNINGPNLRPGKGADQSAYDASQRAEYTLSVTQIGQDMIAKNVTVTDEFKQKGLAKIIDGSIKVKLNNDYITDTCKITVDEDKEGFTIETGRDVSDRDMLYVFYSAEFLQTGTLENTMTAAADNAPQVDWDNDIIIEEPPEPELVIEKESDKEEYETGETGVYKIVIEEDVSNVSAKNVVVTDRFKQEGLAKIKEDSIRVKLGNADITDACKIAVDEDREGFAIETGKDLTNKARLTVTYEAEFAASGALLNTAAAKADNAPQVSWENEIVIKSTPEPALKITKKASKNTYHLGDTGKYTLTIDQTVKDATAEKVVITDKFKRSGMQVKKDTITVSISGKDITKSCEIKMDEKNGFTIKTGTDLTYGERMTVTYKVVFQKKSLAGKALKNTAIAKSDNTPQAKTDYTVTIPDIGYIEVGDPDGSAPNGGGRSGGAGAGGAVTTGDKMIIWIPAMLLLISGAAGAALYRKRKESAEGETDEKQQEKG